MILILCTADIIRNVPLVEFLQLGIIYLVPHLFQTPPDLHIGFGDAQGLDLRQDGLRVLLLVITLLDLDLKQLSFLLILLKNPVLRLLLIIKLARAWLILHHLFLLLLLGTFYLNNSQICTFFLNIPILLKIHLLCLFNEQVRI